MVELYLPDLVVEVVEVVLMTTTINQKELLLEVEVVEVQVYHQAKVELGQIMEQMVTKEQQLQTEKQQEKVVAEPIMKVKHMEVLVVREDHPVRLLTTEVLVRVEKDQPLLVEMVEGLVLQ